MGLVLAALTTLVVALLESGRYATCAVALLHAIWRKRRTGIRRTSKRWGCALGSCFVCAQICPCCQDSIILIRASRLMDVEVSNRSLIGVAIRQICSSLLYVVHCSIAAFVSTHNDR